MLSLQIFTGNANSYSSRLIKYQMGVVLDEGVLEDRPGVDPSVLAASLRAERTGTTVLAFDIGTSGVRAALFDGRGEQIAGSQISCPHESLDLLSESDTDVDALVDSVARAIDVALARAESFVSKIDYVASACFWHSLLGVDDGVRAVTPLFGWAETRAANAVAELRLKFDETEIHSITGARLHPSYWPAKLLWLQQERPDLFGRTRQWLSFSDYLLLRFFGDAVTSVSMASGTGLLNQKTCLWNAELLNGLGISPGRLPPVAVPGRTLQALGREYSVRWPLLDRAAWFPAISDGAANNIGAGCTTAERVALMIGTSGAMRALFAGAPPTRLPRQLFCYRADHDRVVIGGALSDGGGLIRWLKNALVLESNDDLESQLGALAPDAHGLTVLPFWAGERATGWSPAATGSILGLTARTKTIEIIRAAMEAICYRFALLSRAIDTIAPNAMTVAAGNALLSSPTWTQMMADVLARQIEVSTVSEASMHGAALLALEAAGKIDSIETVELPRGEIFAPDMARHKIYMRALERQEKFYQKLVTP